MTRKPIVEAPRSGGNAEAKMSQAAKPPRARRSTANRPGWRTLYGDLGSDEMGRELTAAPRSRCYL
jgi:hypothetical protein